MSRLALLVVTAVAVGGPHGSPPARIANATVAVSSHGRLIASVRTGRLRIHVRPGVYTVSATLGPPAVRREQRCQSRTLRVLRGARSVTLGCSIK